MNKLMNDKGACRTGPATLGLFYSTEASSDEVPGKTQYFLLTTMCYVTDLKLTFKHLVH